MKRIILGLLVAILPVAGWATDLPMHITPDGTVLPAAVNGHVPNLPAGTTIGGSAVGGGTVSTGKTLWVDGTNGNNSTAVSGRLDKPYLTLAAAKAAATSGDLVYVKPGTYNETNIAKNGVNLHLEAGAIIDYTGNSSSIIDDTAAGANTDLILNVTGGGIIKTRGATNSCIRINRAGSSVSVTCKELHQTYATPNVSSYCLSQGGGTLYVMADVIEGVGGAATYWDGGEGHNTFGKILGSVYSLPTGTGGHWHINAQFINGNTQLSPTATSRVWLTAQRILGTGTDHVFRVDSGLVYLNAQKIEGALSGTGAAIIVDGGTLYADVQKVEAGDGSDNESQGVINLGGAASFVTIGQILDTGLSDGTAAIQITGGTQNLMVQNFTRTGDGDGVAVSGGTVNLYGKISAAAAVANSAINVSGGTLNAQSCSLTSGASGYDIKRTAGTANVVNGRGTNAIGTFTTNGTVNFVSTNLNKSLNLSDLASASTARTNLGVTAALTPTAVKTSSYTAAANELVLTDSTSGNVPITFPNAPADGTRVAVKMVTQGGTNTTTLALQGSDVFNKTGGSTTGTLTLLNQAIVAQYKTSGAIWYVTGDDIPLSQLDLRYQPLSTNLTTFAGVTPGTGVATALGVNIGSAGAPVLFNGAGGTPSSLTGTNISGTAASLTAGHVTGLTVASGKTLTASNTITLTGTDGTSFALPATSATLARTDAANTFTGHQTIEGVTSTGSTGSGKFVFDTSPTLNGTISVPTTLQDSSGGYWKLNGSGNALQLASSAVVSWSSTDANNGTRDTGIGRNAAGVVEINNGTAGTLRDLTLRTLTATTLTGGNGGANVSGGFKSNAVEAGWTANVVSVASNSGLFKLGASLDAGFAWNAIGVMEINNGTAGNSGVLLLRGRTIAALPGTPVKGMVATVTDGDSSLAWGATVVNSGAGATSYQVWYNGSNWTVTGK